MFSLGARIGIPCFFVPKSVGLNFGQNNMGSQWQHLNCTLVGLRNITFFEPLGPKKNILERKSILRVKVLKLDFRVLCQPTTGLWHIKID